MKKLITTICLGLACLAVFFINLELTTELSFADNLTEVEFSVKENLSLNNSKEQPQGYFNGKTNSPIVNFIVTVIEVATTIIGTVAMIILIIGGFQLMAAQGNQQNLDNAKDTIKYAVIGLVLAFLSYVIILFVQSIFVTS